MKALAPLLLALVVSAAGATPDRVHALATELRCPVCQNQNLADSNADLAVDLRREIARQVAAGRQDEEIRRFMVERYGHYVLYDPPWTAHTALLWCAPALLLAVGGLVAWLRLRRREEQAA
ncbi:cytochrome c-type biogenesis protein CcmH [Ramlibacter sp. USB13]|uniref:Cytochrome c-type biogenesis protein n=1 Tax=Ramlibacter cellulosilyticus TaxID=2764187 RepID=A0A923SBP3_9BURK|nr:cytochrome c-type biogenesis protein [Ramlibacter cellulosilyticus]MBC5784106.1 cytochrome c-type biogenesis protein CcmH [Ramlibacter cellulosilyticus]